MEAFTSSIMRFGPVLTPYHVVIDDKYVVCRKNNGLVFISTEKYTNNSIQKYTILNK